MKNGTATIRRTIKDRFWLKILAFTLKRLEARKVTVDYDPLMNMTMFWIYWKE
jgi:hypothetical protein